MSATHSTGPFSDGLRFALWMSRRKAPCTYLDVMQAFNVARSTAFRWLSEYETLTAKKRVPVYTWSEPGQKPPTGIVP